MTGVQTCALPICWQCSASDVQRISKLKITSEKKLLECVKGVHIKKYSDCLAGKQHRVAFKSQPPHKKPEVLDLVHSDVCKMSVRSMGGAKYFVTFIDDFSRKVWVYVLKTKDQVLSVFKQLQVSVEREIEKKSAFALIMGESILAHLMPIARSRELGTNLLRRHHS